MKTVVITTSFPLKSDDYRGEFVYHYSKKIEGEVWVVAPHHKNSPNFEKIGENIKLFRIQYAPERYEKLFYDDGVLDNIKNGWWKTLFSAPFIAKLYYFLFKNLKKGDKLITHWVFPTGFIGALLSFQKKIEHHCVVHSAGISILKKFNLKNVSKFIYRNSNSIQFVNKVHQNWFLDMVKSDNDNKLFLKPMPVDSGLLFGKKDIILDKFGYIGRLVAIKGVEKMLKEIPTASKIDIAGDGELYEILKIRYPDINFLGKVVGDRKKEWFYQNGVLVVPSLSNNFRQEGFPTVILEGLASKNLVIVSSKVKGIDYFLKDRKEIIRYNPENIGELKMLLQNIDRYRGDYFDIVQNGYKKVEKLLIGNTSEPQN